MDLYGDTSIASNYKSKSQIARVVSEAWLAANGYCLACDSDYLKRSIANTKCTDFSCVDCGQTYELKTFRRRPVTSLVDGAYASLMTRIMGGSPPALFLLQRNSAWRIEALTLIHPMFLTPPVIEKRPALSPTAARAGWVGCKIRGRAASIATSTLWTGTLVVTFTFLSLIHALGVSGTFAIYAVLSILTFVFILRRVPETKGKTLEQIQQYWEEQSHG